MRLPRVCWQRFLLLFAGIVCAIALSANQSATGQSVASAEVEGEIARQRQIVDRFLAVLERNPRRGTALDKIYGFHVENGTLDGFLKQLREGLERDSGDGAGWLIVGLLESARSRDAAAVEAFTKAGEIRPTDPLALYYLGQSLVLVGQPEKAVAAFEEAIGRKPAQTDLLEIFQALGRVHQRAARTKEALEVWNRLENLFPGDLRVQEQIAVTLAEEGQLAEALPRYEALARQTTDDYRRTVFRMDAAELKIKLNRKSDGIADLEQLLGKLNPENWLFREVRRKIEEVFLRTGDQDGLANYYVAWIAKNADDVEAMGRLARILARQARVPEAQEWLNKALNLAPSRKDLRLAFIEQLVDDQRYAEAAEQYAELDKTDPNNPDVLRDWGKVILRDSAGTKEERQQRAEKVWRRLVAARPTDSLAATQVADLFRNAEMEPQALELYQKAVKLAPTSPQYREYLGEYYHILKRPDEALATWREMAAGKQRTAGNVARLAEVLAQFDYLSEAVREIAEACQLDPKDFLLWLKAADLQIRASKLDAALQSLATAERLTQNDEERDAVLAQQIKTYTLQNRLAELAAGLTEKANAGVASQEEWFLIARYREALREFPEATRAIGEALKLAPNDIRSLSAAARIAEHAGDLKNASDLSRRLAIVDRRNRSEHLQRVAQLEAQLGRPDEALAAGNDLIAAAPGNTDSYQFFADLCFRLNRSEEGLAALRRAVRVNPNEPTLLLSLAAALAGQFRTDEAIELYWQAFEKNSRIEDRLNVIGKLTDLYLQSDKFELLLERLERGRREADRRREMTICIAQAYQSAGDYGMARQELERLLSENSRDTQLLLQLSNLAEGENDFPAAVRYQEQLAKLAPGSETEYRLANLLSRAGSNQEAAAILVRLAAKEEDKEKLLKSIDSLLTNGQEETALASVALKLRETQGDWELIYRYGVSLAKRQPQEAKRQFEALLTLPLDDWELSTTARNRQRKARFSSSSQPSMQPQPQNPISRLDYAHEVRAATGLDPRQMFGSGIGNIWMPENVAFARMAAIGWLYRLAFAEGHGEAFTRQLAQAAESPSASQQDLWNQVYLQALRGNYELMSSANIGTTRRLAERGDAAGQYAYLSHLTNNRPLTMEMLINPGEDSTPPLPPRELALAMESLRSIRQRLHQPGQNTEYMLSYFQQTLFRELIRAGRKDEAEQFIREAIETAHTPHQMVLALEIPAYRGDREAVLAVFDRFAREDLARNDNRSMLGFDFRQQLSHLLSIAVGNTKVQPREAMEIVDRFLTYHIARTNQQRNDRLAALRRQMNNNNNNQGLLYWIGPSARRANSPLAATSAYFNDSSLSVVRTGFEQFRRQDLVSDLLEHFEERRRTASAAEQIYYTLLLAHLHVWNDDSDAALNSLAAALELAPQDVELRLDIARFHLQMQQLDEALAMVDSVTPLDQRVLQQREMLALDLAVRLADQPRALAAARRLYGLRLDAQTQMQVAAQMQRLGMHAEAEAVLARAQRQIGSRVNALVNVMSQHQSDGRMELATEVAQQILRRTHTPPLAQLSLGVQTSDASYRRAALACLNQADKLKEMIAAAEAQLARMPNSEPLLAALLEYYQAATDAEKGLALRERLVELHPDEPRWRFTYACELNAHGKTSAACDEFLLALKKSPGLISDYSPVLQAFKQAKREVELAALLRDFDVHGIVDPGIALEIVHTLLASEEAREASLGMLRRVWDSMPIYRRHLLHVLSENRELWKTPQVFDLVVEGLMPSPDTMREGPWHGLEVVRYEPRGRITSWLGMLLDVAESNGRFAEVRDAVAKGVAADPRWLAGPPILAIIELRLSRPIDAEKSFAALLRTGQTDYMLRNARWVAAQEIGDRKELQSLALDLLNRAAKDEIPGNFYRFSYGPAEALVRMNASCGRRDEARRTLADALKPRHEQWGDEPFVLGLRMRDLLAIGRLTQELQFPAEGVWAYSELLAVRESSDPMLSNWTGRTTDQLRREAQRGLTAITLRMNPAEKIELARALLAPAADADETTPIDRSLTVATTIAPLGKIECLLDRLLTPELLASPAARQIDDELSKLAARHPRNLTVEILRALIALRREDSAARQAVDRLQRLVSEMPLAELSPGKRPNSRLRRQASEQIGLWLVARECVRHTDFREAAERLVERAIEAARRQLEPNRLAAIFYERGLSAIDSGDVAGCEREWNRLIDLALVEPRVSKTKAAGDKPRGPLPATAAQFGLAAALSQAAAEKNLVQVSLRAMREALSGGLPVADLTKTQLAAMAQRNFRSQNNANSRTDLDVNVATEVQKRMWELSRVWRQHGLPPADVSAVLESLVFPASREQNVMLFEQAIASDWTSPKSVGRLLADWAAPAGRADEFRRQIATRRATPADVLAGEVLAFQLDLATGDRQRAREHLGTVAMQLEGAKTVALANTALHAAGLAMADPQLAETALPILSQVAALPSRPAHQEIVSLVEFLTRQRLAHRDIDSAKAEVERYLAKRQQYQARFSDDSGLNLRRQDLAWAATELARAGDARLTLELLGRFADTVRAGSSEEQLAACCWHLEKQLAKLQPAERYALLREWTFPAEGRRSLRLVGSFCQGETPAGNLVPTGNFTLLVAAAKEADALSDLARAVEPLAAEKIAGAAGLRALIQLARGEPAAATKTLEGLVAAAEQRGLDQERKLAALKPSVQPPAPSGVADERKQLLPVDWSEYLAARAALQSPETESLGRPLAQTVLKQAQRVGNTEMMAHVALDLALPPRHSAASAPGLELWHAAVAPSAELMLPAPVWRIKEGSIEHITGTGHDSLLFCYPLMGTFEFSCEVSTGKFAQADIGYGGLVLMPEPWTGNLQIDAVSKQDRVTRNIDKDEANHWRRVRIRVSPQSVQFYYDDKLAFEDSSPSSTSPWLHLAVLHERQAAIKNLVLRGEPLIPREVKLIDGDRLEGWCASTFGERLPERISLAEVPPDNQQPGYAPPNDIAKIAQEPDWSVEGGELTGRVDPLAESTSQSWLSYHRPLLDGERMRYEFFYEPGFTHVYPALGSLAIMLSEEGVRLHRIAKPNSATEPVVYDPRNISQESSLRRGPIPLKRNDWNAIELSLANQRLTIKLNDQLILEKPADSGGDQRFGLFHYKAETAVRVRNMVLSGGWPQSVSLDAVLAPAGRKD